MQDNAPFGEIHIKYDGFGDGAGQGFVPVSEEMEKKDKLSLLLSAALLGFAVLCFYYFGELLSFILDGTDWIDFYYESNEAFFVTQAAQSLMRLLIPFSFFGLLLKPLNRDTVLLPLNKPSSFTDLGLALGIGFLALIVGNYITSFILFFAEGAGFYFDMAELPSSSTGGAFFWNILGSAAVPALTEEFAFRGIMLQSLRKYGKVFAVTLSSLVFALLHGNLEQAPFAFILGCVLAWLVIATESLWTGILIHFLNNIYAVMMETLVESLPMYSSMIIFLLINLAGIILGTICFIRFRKRFGTGFGQSDPGGNTPRARSRYRCKAALLFFMSLPMTAAAALLIKTVIEHTHYIGF